MSPWGTKFSWLCIFFAKTCIQPEDYKMWWEKMHKTEPKLKVQAQHTGVPNVSANASVFTAHCVGPTLPKKSKVHLGFFRKTKVMLWSWTVWSTDRASWVLLSRPTASCQCKEVWTLTFSFPLRSPQRPVLCTLLSFSHCKTLLGFQNLGMDSPLAAKIRIWSVGRGVLSHTPSVIWLSCPHRSLGPQSWQQPIHHVCGSLLCHWAYQKKQASTSHQEREGERKGKGGHSRQTELPLKEEDTDALAFVLFKKEINKHANKKTHWDTYCP